MTRRIGAYILPGDPVWLERTLARYYHLLDALVVPVPEDGRGWTGAAIPVDAALAIIDAVDTRGLARRVPGRWTDAAHPLSADTAQRQAALDALAAEVDWVVQLDNDELLPDPEALIAAIDEAERRGLDAVTWPMRVLIRKTRRHMYEVVGMTLAQRYDYPGPVAVRPTVRFAQARRTDGHVLQAVVEGDVTSLEVVRRPGAGEDRWVALTPEQAIVHASWARTPSEIWQKIRSWGHASGWRGTAYFLVIWLPIPLTWRWLRDIHPFSRGLWPRVQRRPIAPEERD